ncbi:MAG: LCP family protein [Eggerthellaceae bacterium]|nr:LCP family protein [Eggerthellaceae bacterium]
MAILVVCCIVAAMSLAACSSQKVSRSTASESFASSAAVEPSAEAPESAVDTTGVRNILVIGDDGWEGNPSHADMMCLLRVDLDNKTIHEVTVPRDTKYDFGGGSYDKLNQMLTVSGAKAQTDAAAEVVGVPIDYYVKVNFDGLMAIVDHFGGLNADLPYPINYHFYTNDYEDEYFDAGEQTLSSWRVMALSRARTGYGDDGLDDQEMIRQFVDRQMLTTLMQYAYKNGTDQIEPLFKSFQGFIETNISAEEQVAWAKALGSNGSIEVVGTTGPFRGDMDPDTNLWLVTPDPNGWANLMDAIENGGDIQAAIDTYNYSYFPNGISGLTTTTITVG